MRAEWHGLHQCRLARHLAARGAPPPDRWHRDVPQPCESGAELLSPRRRRSHPIRIGCPAQTFAVSGRGPRRVCPPGVVDRRLVEAAVEKGKLDGANVRDPVRCVCWARGARVPACGRPEGASRSLGSGPICCAVRRRRSNAWVRANYCAVIAHHPPLVPSGACILWRCGGVAATGTARTRLGVGPMRRSRSSIVDVRVQTPRRIGSPVSSFCSRSAASPLTRGCGSGAEARKENRGHSRWQTAIRGGKRTAKRSQAHKDKKKQTRAASKLGKLMQPYDGPDTDSMHMRR